MRGSSPSSVAPRSRPRGPRCRGSCASCKRWSAGSTPSRACAQQERNRLAADPGSAVVCASIQHLIDTLDDEMAALQGQIHDHFDRHPPLRQQRDLLTSIPGIGAATAALLLAEFGPMRRFAQARQCAAFVGVVPRDRRSGTSAARQARAVQARLRRRAQSALLSGPHRVALQSHRHRVAQPPTTQRQAPHGDRRRGDA